MLKFYHREWNKELEYRDKASKAESTYQPSLLKAIVRAFGFKFALLGIYTFWEECILRIMQPLFMSWFVRYFSSDDSGISKYEAYAYGGGIVAMSAIYTFTHHQYFFGVMHTGMKLRVAHCSFIYRKVRICMKKFSPVPLRLNKPCFIKIKHASFLKAPLRIGLNFEMNYCLSF